MDYEYKLKYDFTEKQQLKDFGYNSGYDLTSLIEACGDEFSKLERAGRGDIVRWFAYKKPEDLKSLRINLFPSEGKTPEESVAKLWLALNKK